MSRWSSPQKFNVNKASTTIPIVQRHHHCMDRLRKVSGMLCFRRCFRGHPSKDSTTGNRDRKESRGRLVHQGRVNRMVLDRKLLKAVLDLNTKGTSSDLHFGRSRRSVRSLGTCECMHGLPGDSRQLLELECIASTGLGFTGFLILGSMQAKPSWLPKGTETWLSNLTSASKGLKLDGLLWQKLGTAPVICSHSLNCWTRGPPPLVWVSLETSVFAWAKENLAPPLSPGSAWWLSILAQKV